MTESASHHCDWLDAAVWTTLKLRVVGCTPAERERLQIVAGNLLMMCRAEFAAGLAFDRFASHRGEGAVVALMRHADAHALLVSAHLAWRTLDELGRKIRRGGFAYKAVHDARRTHRAVRERCKAARDHAEHVTERLEIGRSREHGGGTKMTSKTFRRSLGVVSGTVITYGDESFDLAEQIAALRDVRVSVAPTVAVAAPPQIKRVVK